MSHTFQYEGMILQKGSRKVRVLFYWGVQPFEHKTPCGERRGKYCVECNGKIRLVGTHNISRMKTRYGYTLTIDPEPYEGKKRDCYLHAHHSVKHQENVIEKAFGAWKKFWKLLIFNK